MGANPIREQKNDDTSSNKVYESSSSESERNNEYSELSERNNGYSELSEQTPRAPSFGESEKENKHGRKGSKVL